MALHFLLDRPLTEEAGDLVVLDGPEAHHAASVRRVRPGEEVTLGDGGGTWLTGDIEEVAPRRVSVVITARRVDEPAAQRIVLVQALAKGDRDELAVQAATELGVDEVVPWQAARSVSRWSGPKVDKGVARWRAIVREASKQAHRSWLPDVRDPVATADLVRRAGDSTVFVLEPSAELPLSEAPLSASASAVLLVVGPEGGIAPDELKALVAAGATPVRLGATVLRTSTAGPAALALVNVRLGRW